MKEKNINLGIVTQIQTLPKESSIRYFRSQPETIRCN